MVALLRWECSKATMLHSSRPPTWWRPREGVAIGGATLPGDPEPPQLPGFRQLSPLRRERHADVYRARQDHPDRWVAVTVFDVRLLERGAAEQFRDEARAIGRLAHLGIVAVHAADVLPDGRPYLVTELCEGSLADRIAERGRLDPREVAAVGLVIGRALQRAHDGGVRHGDLTPGSVLLRDGAVPVLAGVEPAVLRDYRATDDVTPVHAAPETVRADGAVDDRTDVYGLGSILYAALAGAPPFPTRRGEQEHERLARVLLDKPAAPPGRRGSRSSCWRCSPRNRHRGRPCTGRSGCWRPTAQSRGSATPTSARPSRTRSRSSTGHRSPAGTRPRGRSPQRLWPS